MVNDFKDKELYEDYKPIKILGIKRHPNISGY